ncbi:hypothetical protein BDZ91DRAFT_330160 [Kalaharituber pfeilii]|nr:hypothetical protein BDZ91DRAFT_330160 [Kalaharituber pfeilii]
MMTPSPPPHILPALPRIVLIQAIILLHHPPTPLLSPLLSIPCLPFFSQPTTPLFSPTSPILSRLGWELVFHSPPTLVFHPSASHPSSKEKSKTPPFHHHLYPPLHLLTAHRTR